LWKEEAVGAGESKAIKVEVRGCCVPAVAVLLCCCSLLFFPGCRYVETLKPEGPPGMEQIYQPYSRTVLGASSPADVLAIIRGSEYELISQSESVIASCGQKSKGYKNWFNMVAFDQNKLTAKRKYVFVVNDRPNILEEPKKDMSFDCEMVLDSEVLEQPFTNANARRIAILEQVKKNLAADMEQVGRDNATLGICGMMAGQALEAALVKLKQSPALASHLDKPLGVEFSHINLDKGRIQMLLEGNIAGVRIRLGSAAKRFEKQQLRDQKQPLVQRWIYF